MSAKDPWARDANRRPQGTTARSLLNRRHLALAAFVALCNPALAAMPVNQGLAYGAWAGIATAIAQVAACVTTLEANKATRSWFAPAIIGLLAAIAIEWVNGMVPPALRLPPDALAYWCVAMPGSTMATRLLWSWSNRPTKKPPAAEPPAETGGQA